MPAGPNSPTAALLSRTRRVARLTPGRTNRVAIVIAILAIALIVCVARELTRD